MLPELGQIALLLALLIAALQAVLPLVGAQRGLPAWMAVARPAAYAQLLLVGLAFAILTWGFVAQDFSMRYVASNSNSLLPVIYRYTAVWGAHEGSLLLWALILAVWTGAVARFSRSLPERVVARVLGVMGAVAVGFLAFLIFTSNPFERVLPAAVEGRDLNPLLQDPGMIIHPPMLYLGYVGFCVPFAFAIAAMLEGGAIDARWLRWTRPWTNVAWAFLTVGIALGSWWAYYELGWGGWWFWDPVENASFMPWLAGAALLHSQAVTEKRGSFAGWTLLLAIAAFSLSLLGTFLVRSGVLTSVHAFASDPTRGLFILIFLGLVVGGSLVLYALRSPTRDEGKPFATASRETLLLANNLLLTTACAMVLLGTLYPLLADALELGKISVGPPYFALMFLVLMAPLVLLLPNNLLLTTACAMVLLGTLYPLLADALELGKISVGPPYFALMFLVLMAPLVLLLPFGPVTRWQREQASTPLAMLLPWAGLAIGAALAAYFMSPQSSWKVAAGVLGALWVAGGTARFVWTRLAGGGRQFTPEMLGMTLAHLGVAVFLIGALMTEGLSQQREVAVRPGQSVTLGAYEFRFEGVQRQPGPNFEADRGEVTVFRNAAPLTVMHPEKRAYASGGQVMTEAAIEPGVTRDLYVALGEPLGDGAWALRVHVKPFVRWIWAGALLMMLGGLVTATDRRFRTARVPATRDEPQGQALAGEPAR